jgi:hypothetical protein
MKLLPIVAAVAASAWSISLIARAEANDAGTRAETSDAGAELILAPIVNDAGAPATGYLPDPPPLVTKHQWVIDLGYRAGAIVFGGARRIELAKPTGTPRAMGRFALELYIGKELIDRVRFDFPLLGADDYADSPRRWDSPPSFERQLSTRAAVVLPHSERATRAVLVDRATGNQWVLPWPFRAPPEPGRYKG